VTEYQTCDGFIQDNLLEAFRAGVVPIVDGPRNYSMVAPSKNAIIHVDDFPNISDLAAYIKRASEDIALYRKHLDYRSVRPKDLANSPGSSSPKFTKRPSSPLIPQEWKTYWTTYMERGEWSGWCHLCRYATTRTFSRYRLAFPDHESFIRAFRYRLSNQMTWYDADPRLPPSDHVLKFLESIPDPAKNNSHQGSPNAIHSEFKVRQPDQSCVVKKWAPLAVDQILEMQHKEVQNRKSQPK
jgi:hypothetical protein